jgi:hypothetical protein
MRTDLLGSSRRASSGREFYGRGDLTVRLHSTRDAFPPMVEGS